MDSSKPWTAPGLTAHKRALLLLGRPTQPAIEEAIEAAVRDAVQQERERLFERLSQCDGDVMFYDGNAYGIYAEHKGVLDDEDAASTPNGWENEPPREVTG